MLQFIKKVERVEGYKLKLTFNNKEQKIVDLTEYSNEGPETVFCPFRDLEFFKSVRLDRYTGTIVWPNGVDLCPDSLYMRGKDVEKRPRRKRRSSSNSSTPEKPQAGIAAKSKT